MGWVLLALLTVLAGSSALAVALRTKPGGRAELALTTCILWNFLIGCPIYALALTNRLRATPLAWLSAVFFVAVFAAAAWRGSRGSFARSLREIGAAMVDLVTLPFAGIAAAARARSFVVLPLIVLALLIVHTAIASYFTGSWRQWDSLWYHETIVGLTIQNHGFAVADLPTDFQKANGYPRFGEMTQLWFVIFTDRRLIELPNSLIAPGFMFATYVIARRYTRNVVTCMGWAAVAMLMPAAEYLLESTYIDIHVALFVLAGTHYATRPVFRLVDALLAAVCITLAIGTKYLALPPAGIVLFIGFVRLVRHHGVRLRSLATMLGSAFLIGGMAWTVFWRNWVHFRNPLWPDFIYDNAKYNIHLPSVWYSANPLDMNMPVKDFLETVISVPYSVTGLGPKGQLYDYGLAVSLIVFPLSAFALVGIVYLCARDLVGRLFRVRAWRDPGAHNALLVALPVVAQVWMSPALWSSRYHIANVAALGCLVAFWGGRPRWSVFGEGAVAAAAIASLMAFWWVKPRWWWLPSELVKLAAVPYPEREVTPAATISKDVDRHSGSAMTTEVGLDREKLKPGEIAVCGDNGQFPALLWNNKFTNKVIYVPGGPGYFERANAIGARWVYCRNGDPECATFNAATAGPKPAWKDVGVYNTEGWGHIFRRLTP
jgi:hypothetical protein